MFNIPRWQLTETVGTLIKSLCLILVVGMGLRVMLRAKPGHRRGCRGRTGGDNGRVVGPGHPVDGFLWLWRIRMEDVLDGTGHAGISPEGVDG
jgi:hypothetical protein